MRDPIHQERGRNALIRALTQNPHIESKTDYDKREQA